MLAGVARLSRLAGALELLLMTAPLVDFLRECDLAFGESGAAGLDILGSSVNPYDQQLQMRIQMTLIDCCLVEAKVKVNKGSRLGLGAQLGASPTKERTSRKADVPCSITAIPETSEMSHESNVLQYLISTQ